ncbi:MAG TPA: hypothetical protein PLT07_04890, partial [Trueperaceae bacterium]|nr:hypothetical protein [Trueperaceae bacterium]
FRRQVPYLAHAASGRKLARALAMQVVQVAALAAGAAALLLALLTVLARADAALAAIGAAGRALPQPSIGEAALLLALVCLTATAVALGRDMFLSGWESARVARRHAAFGSASGWPGMFGSASGGWRGPALLALALVVGLAAWAAALTAPLVAEYAAAGGGLLAEPGVSLGLLAIAALAVARNYLLTHVADIALYVTSDRVSARARTRRAVLDDGEAVVRDLLQADYH